MNEGKFYNMEISLGYVLSNGNRAEIEGARGMQ
jgi:hypothetical protein